MPDYTAPQKDRAALLTINGQRDFTRQSSPLRVPGVRTALPAMRRLADGFRERRAPIIHALRLYRCDGSNVDIFRRQAVEEGMRILMPGTAGAELVEELKPDAGSRLDPECLLAGEMEQIADSEWAYYKARWGAFHGTGLEDHLRRLGVTTLVLCGCCFTTSVRATIYEAGARDFRVVVACDAVAGASEAALVELGRIGVYLMTTDNCLNWLAGGAQSTAA